MSRQKNFSIYTLTHNTHTHTHNTHTHTHTYTHTQLTNLKARECRFAPSPCTHMYMYTHSTFLLLKIIQVSPLAVNEHRNQARAHS